MTRRASAAPSFFEADVDTAEGLCGAMLYGEDEASPVRRR